MSDSSSFHIRSSIIRLKPYQTGKTIDKIKALYQLDEVIKLASNENPLGPSTKAIAAAQNALSDLGRYPDPQATNLKQALADHLQVSPSHLTLGNGSDSLLGLIGTLFTESESEVIISQYGFASFFIAAQINQAKVVIVPEQDFHTDLEAMLTAITDKTSLIFIANPNNPTGTWRNEADITNFLEQVPPSVAVVLDEAYYEYMSASDFPNSIALQERFPNLIITRTFSKAYGLAAMRVGYAIANPEITDYLNRIRAPFNLTTPSQAAAMAALDDLAHLQTGLALNKQGMAQWTQALAEMGLDAISATCNFLTVNVKQNGEQLCQRLLEKGIILRPLVPYHLAEYVRISIGTEAENSKAISALTEVLGE